jgi:hypothetical protein
VLGVYSLSYFGLTYALRVPEARAPLAALLRKFGRQDRR